ncbi:MAG: PIN domain-containing protein [Gallionella sp.]|nr:PIN domain-containing protein [Gallionella sp.]
MNAQVIGKPPSRFEDVFTVRSDKLKQLRVVIQSWKESSAVIGGAAQFRLVVDSNVVLGDILWLVSGRTNENAKTQLMETIEAETIDLYGPPALFDEVEEKIPLIAADKGLDADLMYAQWETYKILIKLVEPDGEKVQTLKNSVDPDDAEFVALAQTIGAVGVVSKDRHIGQMGANHISVTCITHLRNYSRATAIELNIKVNGVLFATVSHAAIVGAYAGCKALIEGISKAPDWVKVALLVGGLFVFLHPGARASVARGLKTFLDGISEATPFVIAEIAAAIELAQKHNAEAQGHLGNAMKELGRNEVVSQAQ